MNNSGYSYLIQIDTNGNVVLPALLQNATSTDKALSDLGMHAEQGFLMFGRGAGQANSMLGQLKRTALSFGAGFGIAAIGKSILTAGITFEKEMSNVGAISNATADELTMLTKAAQDAGATTVFSATESAQAMSFLAQAGYKANDQVSALSGTLDMAAAGSMDLARAADITVSVLSQYGMQAKEAIVVSDQLSYTANGFNTNISEIAEAMNYFGPTAHAFGISLAESNATIGILANGGLKGSIATRAFGTSISRLANPTTKMQEAMDELGLEVFDTQGKFVGLAAMLGQLEKSFDGLTDQQKQGYISKIFASESIQEMNILLGAGSEALADWTKKIDAAQGTAKRVAEMKLDNLAGDAKLYNSVLEKQYVILYEKIQPALRDLVKDATLFVSSLDTTALGNSLGGLAQGLYQTGATLMKITGFVVKHWQALMNMAKVYISIRVFMMTYNTTVRATLVLQNLWTVAVKLYTSTTRGATVATNSLNAATKASGWGILIGLIGSAAAAMALFADNTQKAGERSKELIDHQFEMEQRERDAHSLGNDTKADWEQYNQGILSDLQKQKVKQAAQIRIERIDNILSQIESEAITNLRTPGGRAYKAPTDGNLYTEKELENQRAVASLALGYSYSDLTNTRARNLMLDSQIKVQENQFSVSKNSVLPAASETAKNISKGGSSQKIINITVGKFQDDIKIYVNSNDTQGKEAARKIADQVNEQLMRIVNSGNNLAG